MAAINRRVFYAVESVGLAPNGTNTFTGIHGVQSVGINTRFNLEQVLELGQISLYTNKSVVPDIEVTIEKCLDGYCPVYLLATYGASAPTLPGRSTPRASLGLSIFSDQQSSASGTPLAQCTASGMYVSAVNYSFPVQGMASESVTLVGNDKTWTNNFTAPTFDDIDSPLAITGSGGVQTRENFIWGSAGSLMPTEVPGISASGTNELQADGTYSAHIQSVKVSCNLGRESLFELGHRGPYFRYVQFPVEVKTDIEMISLDGDTIAAAQETDTTTDQTITIHMQEGLFINLGTKNRLLQVSYGGANATKNGGNATNTYSYQNFSDLSVQHPQDVTTSLRP